LQYVRKYVEKKYGRHRLYTAGLTIYTTLERHLQKAAFRAVAEGLGQWKARHLGSRQAFTPPQAALVAMETTSGRVRAVVGGSDYIRSPFDRAIQARRQPGSAFKPLIYSVALARGFTPASLIEDAPMRLPGSSPGKFWEPRNFEGRFQGPTTLRAALIHSNNIVTIKLLRAVGVEPVAALASRLGIRSPLAANLSLALGSSDVSLLELTAAYSAFGNGGNRVKPIFIRRITDAAGRVLEENQPRLRSVLDENLAFQITHLLKGVIAEGTGRKARGLGIPAAGKTGTTDGNMDAWFVGYTPELAAGVWVGYDQKASLGKRETGGRAAAPIWLAFMEGIKDTLSGRDFPVPPGITFVRMNKETGELSGQLEPGDRNEITWEAFRKETLSVLHAASISRD
ncbi:MAG: penicillin-binding transpeptidase domain-containing protein, partial [Deltaproteobacteria bacterium]